MFLQSLAKSFTFHAIYFSLKTTFNVILMHIETTKLANCQKQDSTEKHNH